MFREVKRKVREIYLLNPLLQPTRLPFLILSFLPVEVTTFWCHLLSDLRIYFSISCKPGLLATNYLSLFIWEYLYVAFIFEE